MPNSVLLFGYRILFWDKVNRLLMSIVCINTLFFNKCVIH